MSTSEGHDHSDCITWLRYCTHQADDNPLNLYPAGTESH